LEGAKGGGARNVCVCGMCSTHDPHARAQARAASGRDDQCRGLRFRWSELCADIHRAEVDLLLVLQDVAHGDDGAAGSSSGGGADGGAAAGGEGEGRTPRPPPAATGFPSWSEHLHPDVRQARAAVTDLKIAALFEVSQLQPGPPPPPPPSAQRSHMRMCSQVALPLRREEAAARREEYRMSDALYARDRALQRIAIEKYDAFKVSSSWLSLQREGRVCMCHQRVPRRVTLRSVRMP